MNVKLEFVFNGYGYIYFFTIYNRYAYNKGAYN